MVRAYHLRVVVPGPLLSAAAALAVDPPPDHRVSKAHTRQIELEYHAPAAALPLTSVELWYTQDEGQTWHASGPDPDAQSPLYFDAPADGLFGLFVILTNAQGASDAPPQAGAPPQQWVFIDTEAPIVQIHPIPVPAASSTSLTLPLRWTAVDAQLGPRPIELTYRLWPDGGWTQIAANLANTGRFDWRVPAGLSGAIEVRVTVRDRGDREVHADSQRLELPAAQPSGAGVIVPATPVASAPTVPTPVGADATPLPKVDDEARRRARRLYQQASLHQSRGEHRLAAARLRDALRIDPGLTPALIELAAALYAQTEFDQAIEAYQLALKQDARSRAALDGLARSYLAKRDYPAAARFLQQMTAANPQDARAWLLLGDVTVYQGDQVAARDCYLKATTRDPAATDVIEAAKLRMTELTALSAAK